MSEKMNNHEFEQNFNKTINTPFSSLIPSSQPLLFGNLLIKVPESMGLYTVDENLEKLGVGFKAHQGQGEYIELRVLDTPTTGAEIESLKTIMDDFGAEGSHLLYNDFGCEINYTISQDGNIKFLIEAEGHFYSGIAFFPYDDYDVLVNQLDTWFINMEPHISASTLSERMKHFYPSSSPRVVINDEMIVPVPKQFEISKDAIDDPYTKCVFVASNETRENPSTITIKNYNMSLLTQEFCDNLCSAARADTSDDETIMENHTKILVEAIQEDIENDESDFTVFENEHLTFIIDSVTKEESTSTIYVYGKTFAYNIEIYFSHDDVIDEIIEIINPWFDFIEPVPQALS